MNRRRFVQLSAAGSLSLPFAKWPLPTAASLLSIHVFSKHLQFLDYPKMAAAAKTIGFDGVDLTVRPGGHVLPERVQEDLPKAVEAIKKEGLQALLMTTAVDDAENPTDRQVLETAAKLGIKYYRMNWFRYPKTGSLPEALEDFKKRMLGLSDLNKKLGLVGCYQNHSGPFVGASVWEIWNLLEHSDPEHLGAQYDIRHAVVEGGRSWQTGLRLLHPRIQTIVLKDFLWQQNDDGQWVVKNVPFGEGMVNFKAYFEQLRNFGIQVPVSMHYEYDMGGAEHGGKKVTHPEAVYEAMRRDLQKAREIWQQP